MKEVKVAFYKGPGGFVHKVIRWWTESKYSHAELILPDGITWVSISPFLTSKVSKRVRPHVDNVEDWEFLTFKLSWRTPVCDYQLRQLETFVKNTEGSGYEIQAHK